MNVLDFKYYYFIGVGGIGMSALARYFNFLGKEVMGYDRTETELVRQLESEGIRVHFSDHVSFIPDKLNPKNTLVIFTPAVQANHTELKYFEKRNFSILKRADVLGEITRQTCGIAVAGSHGKTTTSSLIAHILYEADFECASFLGGIIENYDTNFLFKGNRYTVAEADEYDRSFLKLSPEIGVITSIDPDHLDIYDDAVDFQQTFIQFSEKVSEQLFVKKGLQIPNALTYGLESGAGYDAVNIRIQDGAYHFDLKTPEGMISDFVLNHPGRHNVENSVAAIAVALYLKIPVEVIKKALADFKGVKRRFNRRDIGGKIYIDDYAHHPTELKALIDTLREMFPEKKILGVFQPHLFSRTRDFMDEFAKILSTFDELILLDIYPAREKPVEGITSDALLEKIHLENKEVSTLSGAMDRIRSKSFDVLVTAGAGSIDTLVKPIKEWLYED